MCVCVCVCVCVCMFLLTCISYFPQVGQSIKLSFTQCQVKSFFQSSLFIPFSVNLA